MAQFRLWKRVVALLVAVGLFAVLVAGISADDGDEEVVAAAPLQPTRLVADVPEEYGTLFQIQWGGGSLFQLSGRLAARGCAMNTLWVYDDDRWHPYNRYDVPRDTTLIQEFIGRYERNLPAGTFYATCADQPNVQNLQPTQIVAEVPEEYDTLFDLQWGGGSLLHLKGRLATMGCMANNISFPDPTTSTRHIYNQYNTRSTDPTNQQFVQTFENYIPAGAMQADCYNICEFGGRECLSFEEAREKHNNWDISDISGAPCTDDFHPIVKEKVFPILPIRPDACIIRDKNRFLEGKGVAGFAFTETINTSPAVAILDENNNYRSWTNEHNDILLYTEVHELCHINQQWHWIQHLALDKSVDFSYNKQWRYLEGSAHGKKFIEIVEYNTIIPYNVPVDSPYRDIYTSKSRVELSAELCTLHILNKIGSKSKYNYQKWDSFKGYSIQVPVRDFDTSPYLTPEVVEWLEAYMILPSIDEGVEEAAE